MRDDRMTASVLMAAEGLTVGYPTAEGVVRPLQGFDLTLREREIVGLIGDAGSGKSTAALALMGLVRPPGRIEAGRVALDGTDLMSLDEDRLREMRGREIGVIVQNPRAALNPMLRVGRQIGNVYRAHNDATAAEARARAVEMLRLVGINDPERRVSAYAHELSGGMAQRALIAMALSSEPRLLIADEPTSGLDVTIQAQFLDQMWDTVQKTGSAVLLISQDLGVIANYCDRVAVLHGGRIVEDRPVRAFFANPEHPYSREVLSLQRDAAGSGAERRTGPRGEAPLLAVEGLKKTFPIPGSAKVVQAVERADFTIAPRETLGLVGESGSGKTTVGRCLLRLEQATEGRITFRGQEISAMGARQMRAMRSKMQIVFQDPYDSINPRWTVRRILREPLDLHSKLDAPGKDRRVRELLDMVGLDPAWVDRKPRGLGSGALQRLNIARAIATDPDFIVLDEPTSVLAPQAISGLVALLRRLQDDLGLGFLFISHDLTTVQYLCHRVAVMYLGQIVEVGTVEQVFQDPQHPYSRALLAAHLFPDPASRRVEHRPPERLGGEIPSPVDLPEGCYLAGRCPHALDQCRIEPQALHELDDGRAVRCWQVVDGVLEVDA
ncbi:MAG: ABC transporter ATP-binding protein [Pseudomonadota bacterium]